MSRHRVSRLPTSVYLSQYVDGIDPDFTQASSNLRSGIVSFEDHYAAFCGYVQHPNDLCGVRLKNVKLIPTLSTSTRSGFQNVEHDSRELTRVLGDLAALSEIA